MRPSRFTFSLPAAIIATSAAAQVVSWPLHNLDLAGSRFSPMDQISAAECRVADAALVVPDRRHRRRQQSDDSGHHRRDDVCHRSAGKRVRARRSRRPAALDLRRHRAHRRRREGRLRLPQPRRLLRPRRGLHRRGIGSVRTGREDRETVKTFGTNGQAAVILDVIKERYPDVTAAIQLGYWFTTAPQIYNGVIYIGSTRSESIFPAGTCWLWTQGREKSAGISTRFRRTDATMAGILRDRRGWAASGTAAASGRTRVDDPDLGMIYCRGR